MKAADDNVCAGWERSISSAYTELLEVPKMHLKKGQALRQLNYKGICYLSKTTTKEDNSDKTVGLRAAKAPAEALGGAPVLHWSPLQHRTQLPLRMPKKEL